ncbi:thioredoxin [Lactococcus lactis]|jgi:thioredoxin-related protein|nr:thioredoxin [Lactococcus lactis]
MVEPIINNYSRKNKDIVFTIVANRDKEYSNQSVKYNIKGTPTVIFYREGKEIYRSTNAFTESEFKKTIEMVDF